MRIFSLVSAFLIFIFSCRSMIMINKDTLGSIKSKGYEIKQTSDKKYSVFFNGRNALRGDLPLLCEWEPIKYLEFQNVKFENGYFLESHKCKSLERIALIDCLNADLQMFSEFESLRQLGIAGASSDQDIRLLSKIKKLKDLHISGQNVTSQGVKYLAENAKKIEQLKLEDTEVDDTVFQYLLEMPKLREVSLRRTKVTDDAADRFVEEYRRRYNREVIVYT